MGKPAARMGDMTVHGGSIVKGEPTVLIGGMPAARVGDMHVCPMLNPGVPPPPHVGGPILPPGCPTVLIGSAPAACVGDMAQCSGPPDSIAPPGCPTVLIGSGGGGGGGGGAGQGGGGGQGTSANVGGKVTEPEDHYLDVKFVDKGGKPISGVGYKLKAPDGQEDVSALAEKVRKSGVKEGNYELALNAVTNAKWSETSARVGDNVKLSADVTGFEDGSAAEFRVYEKNTTSAGNLLDVLKAQVSGGKMEAEWTYRYDDDDEASDSEPQTTRGFSMPSYYFVASVGPAQMRSPLLKYQDFVEISLKDADGSPVANANYRLVFENGQVLEGTLDGNGYKRVDDVPPGTWSVEFPDSDRTTQATD